MSLKKIVKVIKRRRSELYMCLNSNDLFQISTYTKINRYPILFAACFDYFKVKKVSNPKTLSYGCSTGEEVFTLGNYFPESMIYGVDINPWCLKECSRKYKNPNFIFCDRKSLSFQNEKGFDAIFCMAVFQRTQNRTKRNNIISKGISFSMFENEIKILDEKLNKNGLLIIDYSDYDFNETSISKKYKPLCFEKNIKLRKRPLYNKENIKISEEQKKHRVFKKILD